MRLSKGFHELWAICTVMTILTVPNAFAQEHVEKAKQFFKYFVDLEHTYDPAVADLYADDAVVKNTRIYPSGETRELAIPAPQYKTLIRKAMSLAKARGDKNIYSECSYEPLQSRVAIHCKRYSVLKKYTSPLRMVVGPGEAGRWVIYEEISESQP